MREILFRGKRTDNGKWIEGRTVISFTTGEYYLPNVGFNTRIDHDGADDGNFGNIYCAETRDPDEPIFLRIYPDTVGQYTGMTDKNGNRIFEGDIVTDGKKYYTVSYDLAGFYLRYASPEEHGFSYTLLPLSNYQHAHGAIIEVIGNIHDNPELLKKTPPSI